MNTGIVDKNIQNEPDSPKIRTHSRFDLSRHNFGTFRFAENAPFFVMESVPKDNLKLRSKHTLRSYTLGSPLMQDVKLNKDTFIVPNEAILPLNWDKVYTTPTIGDDVTVDVGTSVANMGRKLRIAFDNARSAITQNITGPQPWADWKLLVEELKLLIIGEMFFSAGSLAASLGYRFNNYLPIRRHKPTPYQIVFYDEYFDGCISNLIKQVKYFSLNLDGVNTTVVCGSGPGYTTNRVISLREFIELLREDLSCLDDANANVTVTLTSSTTKLDFACCISNNSDPAYTTDKTFQVYSWSTGSANLGDVPVDIARLWAYQLIQAHYYTNDHVDYIYSADLFRQQISDDCCAYDLAVGGSGVVPSFTYNGIKTYYDALSAKVFNYLVFDSEGDGTLITQPIVYHYIQHLFAFRHSLRYMDYFVGSRVSPLAIGDVSANVVSGKVSAIDTTRSIQMQRFLNAVNRSGRKFSNYIKELFNVQPAVDYHNPIYLGHTSDDVFTVENENTADSQWDANAITSNLRSNAERFIFDFFADRPCVVMGILSFDIARNYQNAMDRQLFHKDRFDMFNPFMQFLGDQRVYEAEINPVAGGATELSSTFGYQNRYAEYKQAVHSCFGGFSVDSTNLANWIFVADQYDKHDYAFHISPEFIRSKSVEFDKFYSALTGYSLGTYFHFIMDNYNMVDAKRPMAFNPNIL